MLLLATAAQKPPGTRAQNVNTIGEVPDSGWFTNRIGPAQRGQTQMGQTPISAEAIARGPITGPPADPSRWVIIGEKTSSVHPGFEGDRFDPRAWRPQTPPTAYMEMRDDDAFWAARRVAAFSDELIRAAVRTGQFSDPAAEEYLGDVLIKRRDKIARTYLTAVNPIVDPRLDENGRLTFGSAAFAAGLATGEATYRAAWMRFDNATGGTTPLGDTQSTKESIEAPPSLPTAPDSYIEVDLSVSIEGYPTWRPPIRTWFRRKGDGWALIGLEQLAETRLPEARVRR